VSTALLEPVSERLPGEKSYASALRVTVADVLMLIFVLGILQRSQGSMLDDPGLGWHIRNVDAILQQGGFLTADPFSFPQGDWPWRTNQWLGDAALWLGWHWGGLEGIAVVTTLVLAFTFRLLYKMLVADGVPWLAAVGWTFFAVLGTSLSWVARPNVFSLLFVLVTAWVCDRYHRGRMSEKKTWWLVPLFAVWVNTHGGFLAGLILVGVALAVEIALSLGIPHAKNIPAARKRASHFGRLLAGALAATLVNPYGWNIYPWVLSLLGNDLFMSLNTEWQSPDFHGKGAMRFELFMLALPLLLALSKRRPSLVALAHAVVFLHFALNGQRYVALWVLVTAPMVARLSLDVPWCRRLFERMKMSPDLRAELAAPQPRSGWLAPTAIVVGALWWSRVSTEYSYHAPKNIPVKALQATLALADGGPIFHHYNWGGWLVWHGWPKVRNWIDDRNEVHGQQHIEQYFEVADARGNWQQTLDAAGVNLVCVPPHTGLARELAKQKWREIYRDDWAVVLLRRMRPERATRPSTQTPSAPAAAALRSASPHR
jgi:hypothetical protein